MEREELYRLIDLPSEMIGRLQAVETVINLDELEEDLCRMMDRSTAAAAYESLEARLGEDEDHLAMLYCQLECGRRMYERYREKGISRAIYADTMKCFTRFIGECGKKNGRMFFDRGWWTYRQVSMSLFRIGTLEFELEESGKEKVIAVHIPSDADLSEQAVDSSFEQAGAFFKAFYPDYRYEKYTCDSWLLSPRLEPLLSRSSNILSFQRRFQILGETPEDREYIQWLFQVPEDTETGRLPENTSLQRRVKALLLEGGAVGCAFGILNR